MRRAAALVLAILPLAAGCLQPEEGAGVRVQLGQPAGAAPGWTPLPASCPVEPCAWHWLNVSARAPDAVSLRIPLPLPAPGAAFDPHAADPWSSAWGGNVTVSGNGRARVGTTHHPSWTHAVHLLEAGGEGEFLVRAHALASGPGAAEPWRWNGTDPADEALRAHVYRTLDKVVVTYEATWDGCRREARFTAAALTADRWVPFPGEDRTTCA